MSAPIRLGVIGLSVSGGWAATLLSPVLPPSPLAAKYKLTALCTTSPESAKATAEKYSSTLGHAVKPYHGAAGIRDIARDADVDLVLVVVRVGEHKNAVIPAIEAGKAVFVEWPLAKNLQEAKEITELAQKKGVRSIIGNQVWQSPAFKKINEVVKAGGIGKIIGTTVIGSCPTELGYWGPILGQRNEYLVDADCGGTLLDIAVGHFLAGLIPLLGDFASVSASFATLWPKTQLVNAKSEPIGKEVSRNSEDQLAFTGTLASGALVSVHFRCFSAAKPGRVPFEWIIDGEEGTIKMESDSSFYHVSHPKTLVIKGEKWEPDVPLVDYTGNVEATWAEIAKGESGKVPSFQDAYRVHKVIDAVRRSAREGKRISID